MDRTASEKHARTTRFCENDKDPGTEYCPYTVQHRIRCTAFRQQNDRAQSSFTAAGCAELEASSLIAASVAVSALASGQLASGQLSQAAVASSSRYASRTLCAYFKMEDVDGTSTGLSGPRARQSREP